jgi:hypothetical protein
MITSIAFIAAMTLAPAQGGLTLGGARVTYGELGSVRPDLKFLPGDIFFVGFDIDGIKVDETGKVKYSMGMEVVDKDNKAIFIQKPQDRDDFLPLGGTKLPARAFVSIGLDQAPGTYTCRVTVVDLATKTSKTLEQNFDVIKAAFGLVQVFTSSDGKGEIPAPPLGVAGQSIFVHFAVIGFARDAKAKQPDLDVEMAVLNKDGTPALPKPSSLNINSGVDAKDSGIPLRFLLPMNRAGDFTVELKSTDKVSKATSRVTFPIKVLPTVN